MTRMRDDQVAEALEGTRFHKGFVGLSDQSIGEWYWTFGFAEAIDALRLLAEAKGLIAEHTFETCDCSDCEWGRDWLRRLEGEDV